jgi:predicted AAA+ superfamily ATPase
MLKVPKEQILARLSLENPWWSTKAIPVAYDKWTPRPYLELFFPLLVATGKVRRAIVLLGPRRVGKTVLIHHVIGRLLRDGASPTQIAYCSVDHPLYNSLTLEQLLEYCAESSGTDFRTKPAFIFFDEIQYHRDWEIHLKSLVDTYPKLRIVVSGSAAAALRLKSIESGAGRFTDFLLPPLTFHEYLSLLKAAGNEVPEVEEDRTPERRFFHARNIEHLNDAFLHYLNYGGYPEVVLSQEIQTDPARFVKADIIDKVLLRDLPSLYGIQDIQELNSLFTTLAFNTANEVTLEGLSQGSGVAKNTIKRYIEYLEAAFLIRTVQRVDLCARRFKRANFFKVYLTNPSIRSALFSPVRADDEAVIGSLAETAVFAQWFHSQGALHYARWRDGEIDIIKLTGNQRVAWAVEVKWSDRYGGRIELLNSALQFCHQNNLREILVTTKTERSEFTHKHCRFELIPASEYCYTVGRNIIEGMSDRILRKEP